MKGKLVVALEEKIMDLEGQVEMLLGIIEDEEILDSHVRETPVPQVQGRKEPATK